MELDSSELTLTFVQIFAELSKFANGLMAEGGTGVFGSYFFPTMPPPTEHHNYSTTNTNTNKWKLGGSDFHSEHFQSKVKME